MLREALKYLRLGLCVIPARGKIPAVQWKDYQERRPTEEQVRKWWQENPDHNVACVLGSVSGGLIAFDLDSPEAKEEFKKLGLPTDTWISKTGRGWHVFYRAKTPPSPGRVADHLELKSTGNVVILPPGLHPSGVRYRWLRGHGPEDCKLRDLPEGVTVRPAHQPGEDFSSLWKGVPEGMRNETLVRLAGSLFRSGLNLPEVVVILRVWNQQNTPPLTERELQTTLRSIWRREITTRKTASDLARKLNPLVPENVLSAVRALDPTLARRITLYDLVCLDGE